MKILITGIAGFIGSNLAESLILKGYEVHGVDNYSPYYDVTLKHKNANDLQQKGCIIYDIDLRNLDSLMNLEKDYKYIFHLAAQPGLSSTSTFENYYSNNFIATNNILEFAILNKSLNLFVNISTSSVYGINATLSEQAEPKPSSYYGVTKLAAEQLALSFSRNNLLKVCSLRLYSVYGPRERTDKLYPRLVKAIISEEAFTLFEGSDKHLRSFTYVDDVVNGIVSVINKEAIVNGEIYNIGNDKEYTTIRGVEIVENIINKKAIIKITEKRTGDQLRTFANIDKAKRDLSYLPMINLEQGLMLYIDWFKKNIKL